MSSIVYNMDCIDGMKQYPDKYFDLAIVDPPYGAGFTEGGGCTGWFTKYREDQQKRGGEQSYWNRFGERFDRYKQPTKSGGGIPRTNFHGKKKYEHPQTGSEHEEERQMGQAGLEQRQKNHFVGCGA